MCSSPGPGLLLLPTLALPHRLLSTVRLQGQRATSLNNVLSEARSAFRLLFGRCLLPGELLLNEALVLAPCAAAHAPLDSLAGAMELITRACWLLFAGMTAAPSTVKVGGETLRIHLQSPVPDGAVTDYSEALQARGSLKSEPQGVIRTFEAFQLHLVYGWHALLHQLRDLQKW